MIQLLFSNNQLNNLVQLNINTTTDFNQNILVLNCTRIYKFYYNNINGVIISIVIIQATKKRNHLKNLFLLSKNFAVLTKPSSV